MRAGNDSDDRGAVFHVQLPIVTAPSGAAIEVTA
jgi:hypothetical protein